MTEHYNRMKAHISSWRGQNEADRGKDYPTLINRLRERYRANDERDMAREPTQTKQPEMERA